MTCDKENKDQTFTVFEYMYHNCSILLLWNSMINKHVNTLVDRMIFMYRSNLYIIVSNKNHNYFGD